MLKIYLKPILVFWSIFAEPRYGHTAAVFLGCGTNESQTDQVGWKSISKRISNFWRFLRGFQKRFQRRVERGFQTFHQEIVSCLREKPASLLNMLDLPMEVKISSALLNHCLCKKLIYHSADNDSASSWWWFQSLHWPFPPKGEHFFLLFVSFTSFHTYFYIFLHLVSSFHTISTFVLKDPRLLVDEGKYHNDVGGLI